MVSKTRLSGGSLQTRNLRQQICIVAVWMAALFTAGLATLNAMRQEAPKLPAVSSPALSESNRCWLTVEGKNDQTCVPVSVLRVTFPSYSPGQPPPTVDYQQSIHDLQLQIITSRDQLGQLQKALLNIQQGEIDGAYAAAAPSGMKWDATKRIYVNAK